MESEVSSWPKLLRIIAYVFRFIYNIRHAQSKQTKPHLVADEITQAKHILD